MTLQWRPQFSVGNDLIDTDHQYLLEIINKAEVSLQSKKRPVLLETLDELSHYGAAHFEREELVAKAIAYPQADQLHASHSQLLVNLELFKTGVADTWSDETAANFTALLRDWLINHVIKEDMLMKPWLAKHSQRFDPRC